MFIRSCIIGFVLLGLVLLTGNAWAAPSSLEGIVKDPKGKAVKGAEVRVEAKDGSRVGKFVKTDTNGHYLYTGLQVGSTYNVTLVINSVVKASINNVKMTTDKPTQQLNFDLKKETASASTKGKHMVWIPAQTGSNIGGRWVEVYKGGDNAAAAAEATGVRRGGAGTLRAVQSGSGGQSGEGN